MKILCKCGHIIVDQTDNLPYKGINFADEDDDRSFGKLAEYWADFCLAVKEGKKEEFVTQHFGEGYPNNLEVVDIASDMIGGLLAVFGRQMYECADCGRLWLTARDKEGQRIMASYAPESDIRGVLRSYQKKT
jgi:hypothetical protein